METSFDESSSLKLITCNHHKNCQVSCFQINKQTLHVHSKLICLILPIVMKLALIFVFTSSSTQQDIYVQCYHIVCSIYASFKCSSRVQHPNSFLDKNMLKDMLQLTTSQFALGNFKHAKSVLIIPLLTPSPTIEIIGKKIKRYVLPLFLPLMLLSPFAIPTIVLQPLETNQLIISIHHWG